MNKKEAPETPFIERLMHELLLESREVIQVGGLRHSGVSDEKIKEVFLRHGVEYTLPF